MPWRTSPCCRIVPSHTRIGPLPSSARRAGVADAAFLADLAAAVAAWSPDTSEIGTVFLRHVRPSGRLGARWSWRGLTFRAASAVSALGCGGRPTQFGVCPIYVKFIDSYASAKEALRRSEERSSKYRAFVQVRGRGLGEGQEEICRGRQRVGV